jgi:DNA (cytosine-5)-methyltransferase 1
MPKKNSYITVTDQFCGAGGSSQGAFAAGCEVKMALNHWKLAIETHNTNFPNTQHDCTDISACDPRRYPSTDILITSPECTNHSLAKGQKQVKKQMDLFDAGKHDAAAERSRATMWDVCRFAEYHQYNSIIVENVVDARKWVLFDSWLTAMYALGYQHKCVYLNSMHCHPTPQSRDRMYVVFWKKGNKAPMLDYMPLAFCPTCNKDVQAVQTWKSADKKFGKYKQQYVYCCPVDGAVVEPYYHAAFNIIDWSDIGTRIGDRIKPLSENTVKRIEYGLKKYSKEPLILHSLYGKEARGVVRGVSKSAFTQTTLPTQAICTPIIVNDQHSTGIDFRVKSVNDHLSTIPTAHGLRLVTPFITLNEHTKTTPQVKSIDEPIQTQATRQTMGLVSSESWKSFISYYYGTHQASNITDALGSATTKERHQLITHQQSKIEDCYYRMLKPIEIKMAMAFGADYVVLGSGKDQVKQLGNAVTPPAMRWLVQQVVQSLQ